MVLTHRARVMHICVGKLTVIGSDNGLSPGWRQAIIWTNAGILLIGPLGTNFSDILIEIQTFSFKKAHLKMLSAKWRPFCLGLNVLKTAALQKFTSLTSTSHLNDKLVISGCNTALTKTSCAVSDDKIITKTTSILSFTNILEFP